MVKVSAKQWFSSIFDLVKNPINIGLFLVSVYVFYKLVLLARRHIGPQIMGNQEQVVPRRPKEPPLPSLESDLTISELRQYDGTGLDGRILIAVNGNIYDVTSGKQFYGVGAPYAVFAGTDASRNLATFSVKQSTSTQYDELRDLSESQLSQLREWDLQFKERYPYVGKLLRCNERQTEALN